jgi:CBS domain-containing protein
VETSAISHRVADFLKKHPPFQAMEESDLLDLAARGRVKFHEPNEYILWQGEPHRHQVFVIQQGTVSLWDEAASQAELRDVRGAGDMLGVERFTGAEACLHSARSSSDVLVYAFPAYDFELLLDKYPKARDYVTAYGSVVTDYQATGSSCDPRTTFVHDLVAPQPLHTTSADTSIAQAAQSLLSSGAEAIAVVDSAGQTQTLVTRSSVLAWVAAGGGDPTALVTALPSDQAVSVGPESSIADGLLSMGSAGTEMLVITAEGSPGGALHAVVTARDLAPAFGDHPLFILQDIRRAATTTALRALNQRARAFALQQLGCAASVDWVAQFLHLTDASIVRRLLAWTTGDAASCWCFCGAAGRTESLTRLAPSIVVLSEESAHEADLAACRDVSVALAECDFLPAPKAPLETAFHVATVEEWQQRFTAWIRDPIIQQIHRARPLFDLRPIHGSQQRWRSLRNAVDATVDRTFLRVLANDCLASLPPLTFFQDAVVDETGEESPVFRLEQSALRPLVDVGRVFGFAAKRVFGCSTLDRFESARSLLPEHQAVFREAAEALRIVLWLQGRTGISQGTTGAELPPALVGRHERQLLKGGFRSIHRLLEITAASSWIEGA